MLLLIQEKLDLTNKQVLTEKEYRDSYEKYGNTFKAGMGAEAVKELFRDIDLEEEMLK